MFVVVGDAHLMPYTWASMPQVKGDSYRSFSQAVSYAIENKADGFVLAGDTMDVNHPPMESVAQLLSKIQALNAAGIPVYAIPGNHDPDFWVGVSGSVTNLDLANQPPVKLGARTVIMAGIRSLSPEPLQERLRALPKSVDVLVLHQLLKGLTAEFDGHQIWNLDPAWVPTHVRLVLMGDLHESTEFDYQHGDGVTKFIYTGSTYMNNVAENPVKSFLVVDDLLRCKRIPLNTRPFLKTALMGDANKEVELFAKSVHEAEPDTLVLVKYDPRIPDIEERIREGNDHVHFMFRPVRVETIELGKTEAPVGEVSLASCLSREVDSVKDPFLYSFILDLLKTKDTKEVIEGYRTRVMENTGEDKTSKDQELLPAQPAG